MPKRTDISSILIIGAGPIIIGQACEFDYSGTQAVKALKEEGYRIILVNSNPATIMTDPEFADATYVEPITPEIVAKIIEKERPDAVLPTMGGQTALNTALALFNDGTLEKFGVQMIGADAEAIDKAEDRIKFRDAMDKIGLESARSRIAHTMEEAMEALELTLVDGSQVPAYRSDYIPGNLKRLSHIMGERVYDIMSSPKLMDEQKWNEVVKVYDATKQALDVHVQLIQRQRKAIGIPSTIDTIVTKKESDEGEPEREHGP